MTEKILSKELSAMVALEQALSDLEGDARNRVISWAASRFDVALQAAKRRTKAEDSDDQDESETNDPNSAESLAEFYDQASPSTEGEKVLVAGYWFQYRENAQELDAQSLNGQLKHLGHGVQNITRAMGWTKKQKPALMVQKRKDGSTQQARKKFVVTNEGKKYVERMLTRTS